MKVTAFTRYGSDAASTRQRLLQYLPTLAASGIEVDYHPLLDDDHVRAIATGRRSSPWAIASYYLKRLNGLAALTHASDLVWVYAELFPYLPAAFETRVFSSGKPVIYDFDDAFFLKYELNSNPLVRAALGRKLEPLLSGAAACLCGNSYLQAYANRFCSNSVYLPTVVDTVAYRPAPAANANAEIVVGWMGSPSTWRYVVPVLPVLRELAAAYGIRVKIVGAGPAANAEAFPQMDLAEWTLDSEVPAIQAMDIGIMPVVDEPWALGKCGYKLIQYMGCGLPVVTSPVGVATRIVDHGVNGFLATSSAEWAEALARLIQDAALRRAMGQAGRAKVEQDYSLAVHGPRLTHVLTEAVRANGGALR